MATEVEIGRTFLYDLIGEHIAGNDIVQRVSMAKYNFSGFDDMFSTFFRLGVIEGDHKIGTYHISAYIYEYRSGNQFAYRWKCIGCT